MIQPSPMGMSRSQAEDGATFNRHAAVLLVEFPVREKSPQETVAGIGRQDFLLRRRSILDFGNAGCKGTTEPTLVVNRRVVYVVVGVENDSDEFLFQKPKKNLEVVAVMADQLRFHYLWRVDVLVIIVILNQRNNLLYGHAGNEYGAHFNRE